MLVSGQSLKLTMAVETIGSSGSNPVQMPTASQKEARTAVLASPVAVKIEQHNNCGYVYTSGPGPRKNSRDNSRSCIANCSLDRYCG